MHLLKNNPSEFPKTLIVNGREQNESPLSFALRYTLSGLTAVDHIFDIGPLKAQYLTAQLYDIDNII